MHSAELGNKDCYGSEDQERVELGYGASEGEQRDAEQTDGGSSGEAPECLKLARILELVDELRGQSGKGHRQGKNRRRAATAPGIAATW